MFDIDTIKEVRDRTGHGLAACKDALQQAGGDADAAVRHLVGHAVPKPREGKAACEGRLHSYVHHTSKVAVLVEVNCETDFAARSTEFTGFCETVAMQVAAMDPPDLEALLLMPLITDVSRTMQQALDGVRAVLGETIVIRRFVRWSLGD